MKAELKLSTIVDGGLKTVTFKVECSDEMFVDVREVLPQMMEAGVLIRLEREEL